MQNSGRTPSLSKCGRRTSCILHVAFCIAIAFSAALDAQQRGAGGRGGPAASPRDSAALDLTGYWVSVITEDWQEKPAGPTRRPT